MTQSLINSRLMLYAQRRCWPLWLGFLAAWIVGLVLPLAVFTSGDMSNPSEIAMQDGWRIEYYASLIGTMIAAIVSAVFVWEYLFKNPAAMFYGSAPISRTGLFVTMFAAGLLPLLAIELVVEVALLVLAAFTPAISVSACLSWLGATAGFTFVFYCIAVLSAQVSGERGIAFVVYLLLCTGFYQVELLIEAVVSILLPSVVANGGFLVWASPAFALAQYCLGEVLQWLPLIVYCLFGIVLLAIALVLNERRDLEAAGSAVAIRGAAGVLKVVLGAIVAVFFGLATLFLFSMSNENPQNITAGQMVVFSAMLAAGAFLGTTLCEAAFKRGLNAWKASWKQGLAVSACCLVLVCGVYFDVLGMTSYVPNAENVEHAELYDNRGNTIAITEPEDINELIGIHKQFIARNGDEDWQVRHGELEYASGDAVISYTMSDGEKVTRSYTVYIPNSGSLSIDEEIASRLDKLVCSRNVIDSWFGEYLNYAAKGYGITLYYMDKLGDQTETLSSKELADFVDNALLPDIREHGALRVFSDETELVLGSISFGSGAVYTVNITKEGCPNILAWFKENKNLDLTKVSATE